MNRALLVFAGCLALCFPAKAAASARAVYRPPLPQPMPELVKGGCPGLEHEVAGCFIPAGTADPSGNVHASGVVYTDGYRFTTLHELGHAFDEAMMDDGERKAFAHAIGRLDEEWSYTYTDEQGRVIQSPGSLAEAFGDAYAHCRQGDVVASGREWTAGYDYYPTASENRRACGIIQRAGRDPALRQPLGVDSVPQPVEVGVQ
jgi:hypothetical protein